MRGALLAVLLVACRGGTALPIDAECNPLGGAGCLTPWPTSIVGGEPFAPDTPISIELAAEIDPASLLVPGATVLIDLGDDQRIAHVASLVEPTRGDVHAIRIAPIAPLRAQRRYAVAITSSVRTHAGEPLAQTPGFAALADGHTTDHALLEEQRPQLSALLAELATHGLPADDLVVAWEFTTR